MRVMLGRADALITWDRHLFASTVQDYLRPHGVQTMREQELLERLKSEA